MLFGNLKETAKRYHDLEDVAAINF